MDSIELIHFRNYAEEKFELGKNTVFIGPNGSGKTNVIEAIRTISVTKSYRVQQDKDMIQWGENYCRSILSRDNETYEYVLTNDGPVTKKVIKHNGVVLPLIDMYGLVPTVLFSPETMQLIDGPPQERRRFLDTLLSQVSKPYLEALLLYKKILRERHFVLLRIQTGLGLGDELEYWDSELVRNGTLIMEERLQLVTELNTALEAIYPQFLPDDSKQLLRLDYKPSCKISDFAQVIKSQRSYDIKTTTTKTGPHRDELLFTIEDRDVTLFASRGELRRSILSTKIAEAQVVHSKNQHEPILLLDDVFSELDDIRRSRLKGAIEGYQTIITTTDESFVKEMKLKDVTIHNLSKEQKTPKKATK